MEKELFDEIPSLDLQHFYGDDASRKSQFVTALGTAFHNIGFVAIRNHFLDDALQDELYSAIQRFFALPDEVKARYERTDLAGQRGYTGKGKEHAKGRNTGDLKEFFHVGQELPSDRLNAEGYPANIWPKEVPQLQDAGVKAFKALEKTSSSPVSPT